MSPFHQSRKNMMSGSVDSIVTITTLAEDDVESVIGQVAGWCGSFDKLLSDPLGVQYLLVSVCICLSISLVHCIYNINCYQYEKVVHVSCVWLVKISKTHANSIN